MSSWCADLLTQLARKWDHRGLSSLGVLGVMGWAVEAVSPVDAARLAEAVAYTGSGVPGAVPEGTPEGILVTEDGVPCQTPPTFLNRGGPAAFMGGQATTVLGAGAFGAEVPAAAGAAAPTVGGKSYWEAAGLPQRPPIAQCSEADFMRDLVAFVQAKHPAVPVNADTFPETVLNGLQLDLYTLYKEVVLRGGFTVGNGINWKGQVFPAMKNFTDGNKMTGVGNTLKRHYQAFLLAYEECHPEDLTSDRCAYCGGGEGPEKEWVSCEKCGCWVHFNCDQRPDIGTFQDYNKDAGRDYVCIRCAMSS